MKPTVIRGADTAATKPEDWDEERHGPCLDIMVRRNEDDGSRSLGWLPDAEDLAKLNAGAAVVLTTPGFVPVHKMHVEEIGADVADDDREPDAKPSPAEREPTREELEAKARAAFAESEARNRKIVEDLAKPPKFETVREVDLGTAIGDREVVDVPPSKGPEKIKRKVELDVPLAIQSLNAQHRAAIERLRNRRTRIKEAAEDLQLATDDAEAALSLAAQLSAAIEALGGKVE